MKNRFTLTILIVLLSFISCIEEETSAPSCLNVEKVSSNNFQTEVKVGNSVKIPFQIINECFIDTEIFNLEYDKTNEFFIEGIKKKDIITEQGMRFNIIFSPNSVGEKRFGFSLKTTQGTIIVNFGAKGI